MAVNNNVCDSTFTCFQPFFFTGVSSFYIYAVQVLDTSLKRPAELYITKGCEPKYL